jgi:hypothetical protein
MRWLDGLYAVGTKIVHDRFFEYPETLLPRGVFVPGSLRGCF